MNWLVDDSAVDNGQLAAKAIKQQIEYNEKIFIIKMSLIWWQKLIEEVNLPTLILISLGKCGFGCCASFGCQPTQPRLLFFDIIFVFKHWILSSPVELTVIKDRPLTRTSVVLERVAYRLLDNAQAQSSLPDLDIDCFDFSRKIRNKNAQMRLATHFLIR